MRQLLAGAQSTPAGTHPAALFPRVANPCPEEPDAGILHVRIRGAAGGQPPAATRANDSLLDLAASGLSLEVLGWKFRFGVEADKPVLTEAEPIPAQVT